MTEGFGSTALTSGVMPTISDCLAGGDAMDGKGQSNGFRIANAMQPDGTPVELKYIDFVKVQVGVNAKSGPLGEVSTEVFSFADLSIAE